MSQIPAGWYPDPTAPPADPPHLRYWDGSSWTEHAAASPVQTAYAASGPTTPDGVPLSGWWWRVLAQVIDGLLILLVSLPFSLSGQVDSQRDLQRLNDRLTTNTDMGAWWHDYFTIMQHQMRSELPWLLLPLVYIVGMLLWKGATVGKLAVGLRVRLRERPGRLPVASVLLRVLVQSGIGVLPYLLFGLGAWTIAAILVGPALIFGLLDILWPLWDKKRQALHDKLARTNVVKVR